MNPNSVKKKPSFLKEGFQILSYRYDDMNGFIKNINLQCNGICPLAFSIRSCKSAPLTSQCFAALFKQLR